MFAPGAPRKAGMFYTPFKGRNAIFSHGEVLREKTDKRKTETLNIG